MGVLRGERGSELEAGGGRGRGRRGRGERTVIATAGGGVAKGGGRGGQTAGARGALPWVLAKCWQASGKVAAGADIGALASKGVSPADAGARLSLWASTLCTLLHHGGSAKLCTLGRT